MRAPARPDDHTATRQRLLLAAERLFAERGFAATSVRDVTAAAGSNIAAVNYHFGGKEKLYESLFESRLAGLRERRIESVRRTVDRAGSHATLELLLTAFANAFIEPLVEEGRGRHLIGLLSREMLDPHLPSNVFERGMIQPVHEVLRDALIRLTPRLRRRDAARCVVSIIGQLVQVAHRCRWAAVAEGPTVAPPQLSAMVKHVVRFSAAGVRQYVKGRR